MITVITYREAGDISLAQASVSSRKLKCQMLASDKQGTVGRPEIVVGTPILYNLSQHVCSYVATMDAATFLCRT